MMKTTTKSLMKGTLIALMICLLSACGGKKQGGTETNTGKPTEKTLNISVFLDLSDRLIRDMTPSQMSRDTAIIGFLADYFKAKTLGPQILKSKNSMKIFFYPTPQSTDIATLASGLSVEMDKYQGKARRIALEEMKGKFQENLTQIYKRTIEEKNWIGCDIWDFFSSKKVDIQCVRKDARNILVILTDGYLFDANHKIENGTAYSYILPQTLKLPESSLIVKRDGLNNLEVRILELNPYSMEQRDKMVPVLEDWLVGMGVEKEHITVAETDLPINTQTVIRSFMDE